jgi:hypothetical protein
VPLESTLATVKVELLFVVPVIVTKSLTDKSARLVDVVVIFFVLAVNVAPSDTVIASLNVF